MTVEFQTQTSKLARYCGRKKLESQDVEMEEWESTPVQSCHDETEGMRECGMRECGMHRVDAGSIVFTVNAGCGSLG